MGRGSSGQTDRMNVAWDRWGKMLEGRDEQTVYDENGDSVGYIHDEIRYNMVPDIQAITKKQVLEEIDAWRMDDGTYGDEDTKIYLAYKDGKFVDTEELDGKTYKKSGIIGASISTGDFEMVWGGEISRNGKFVPWKTWSVDDNGYENSYSGYKEVSQYKVRTKTTYNNPIYNKDGELVRYATRHETIRKSQSIPYDDKWRRKYGKSRI